MIPYLLATRTENEGTFQRIQFWLGQREREQNQRVYDTNLMNLEYSVYIMKIANNKCYNLNKLGLRVHVN